MKGFVKKKTTRIAGIITVLALALVIAVVTAVATSTTPAARATVSPLRVAIYCGPGSNPANIAATFRAVQACGFDIYGISLDDIAQGRLNTTNYDVLLLPAGASDQKIWYYDTTYGFTAADKTAVGTFAASGGGVVGLEAGAAFMCKDPSSAANSLNLYGGAYTSLIGTGAVPAEDNIVITDSDFGSGTQQLYRTIGGGTIADYTNTGATDPCGTSTAVATYNGAGVIQCAEYGTGATKGHVVVCMLAPEIRCDSLLDWTIWDNWKMNGTQTNSIGGWSLLGRMLNYAATGTATAPTVTEHPNPTGDQVAIFSSVDYAGTGGVYPALLPCLYLAVAASGRVPLAIRAADINGYLYPGVDTLTTANFKALIIPQADCEPPNLGLAANMTSNGSAVEAVKKFANSGGGVMGIGEGTVGYLSASLKIDGTVRAYTMPCSLFAGTANFIDTPLTDVLLPVTTSGSVVGTLNSGGAIDTYVEDKPTFTDLNLTNTNSSAGTAVSTYGDSTVADVLCTYGAGRVLLAGPNHELLCGSDDDWTVWDNYVWGTNTPFVNPDNPKPWSFISAAINNWLDPVIPTVTDNAPAGWKRTAVTVTLTPVDTGGPGIGKTQYRLEPSSTWVDAAANKFVVAAPAKHSNDGKHIYEYRALDTNGIASAAHTCTVRIDTTGPTTAGKAASGKKGHAISLKYRITDKLSPSATAVTLTVKTAKGKLVKKLTLGTKATNKWLTVKWTPKAKGSYSYSITARDLAGNKQTKAPASKITVSK